MWLKYPFQFAPGGGTAVVTDPAQDLTQQIGLVLSTITGDRVMRPDYGSSVPEYLFETLPAMDDGALADAVGQALATHVPGASVMSVEAAPDWESATLYVIVVFRRRDSVNDEPETVTYNLGRIIAEDAP